MFSRSVTSSASTSRSASIARSDARRVPCSVGMASTYAVGMTAWVVRGVPPAVFNVVARILLGFAIGQVAAVGIVAALGRVGGGGPGRRRVGIRRHPPRPPLRRERRPAHPLAEGRPVRRGPRRRPRVALDLLPVFDLGDNSLLFELTSGAAWTALLIFVPAMVGVGIAHHRTGARARRCRLNALAQVRVSDRAGIGRCVCTTADPMPWNR